MPDVKWVKITTDMFDDEKIVVIESMPDSDALLVIWVKLICQAAKCNDAGNIYLSPEIPFTQNTLAKVFHRPESVVQLALTTFKSLGMIDWESGRVLYLNNFEKHQNIEGMERLKSQWRIASQKLREKKKQLSLPESSHMTSYDGHSSDKTKTKNRLREEKEEDISIYVNYWETIKKNLETQVNKGNYDCNVAPLKAAGADNEVLILTADRADIVDRVESMRNLIEKELVTVTGGTLKHFTIFVERVEE